MNPEATEQKRNLLIRDSCQKGTNSVHGMHVVNTATKYYLSKTPERCIKYAEKEKKNMYLESWL